MSQANTQHPLARTGFIVRPLETHAFEGDPKDDYYCRHCHRPRALHAGKDDVLSSPLPDVPGKMANRRKL